jgi:hypothetical protein
MVMDVPDPSREPSKLHVSTLLVASERALVNALDELGFAENDDRVIEHEGRFAFITCSHDPDCDDLFALITELAARGETWELQFRIDTGESRAIFQRIARHQPVEAMEAAVPPEPASSAADLPVLDLDTEKGKSRLAKTLGRVDPAEVFVTLGSNSAGRAVATIVRRNPRGAIAAAEGADEASLRAVVRELLPTVMFSVAMKPPFG